MEADQQLRQAELPAAASKMLAGSAATVDPDHIRSVFVRYGELLTRGETPALMMLFAEDAVVRDPVTGPEHRGRGAIAAFYQGGFDAMGGGVEMKLEGAVRIVGAHGAAAYIARTPHHDPVYRTETLDVMSFDEAGLITSMTAYWGPTNFSVDARPGASR